MAGEPLELAKNYDKNKTPFPALAQVKYDGVPLVFTKYIDGTHRVFTRQMEEALSVSHLEAVLWPVLENAPTGACIVAECLVPGKTFKESSGIIRRKQNDPRIVGVVFDGWLTSPEEPYRRRFHEITEAIKPWTAGKLSVAPSTWVEDHGAAMAHWSELMRVYGGKIEGMMLHHVSKTFQPGKRCWGMGRYKPQPTIDLEVVSYEEARSEMGEPLGMVGRVNVRLRRQGRPESVIGVGPGRLTHEERTALWRASLPRTGSYARFPRERTIVEIKYMPDPSYDALRQPTIQRIRKDKDEPDTLVYEE